MKKENYDLFISHKQENGGNLALNIKMLLLEKYKNMSIFLDVDDLENIHDLEKNIKNSENLLLLITEDVFKRPFVIKELGAALKYNKNIIVIWDKAHCPVFPNEKQVPDYLISILHIRAITWSPEIYIRNGIIHEIIRCMNYIDVNSNDNINENNKNVSMRVLGVTSIGQKSNLDKISIENEYNNQNIWKNIAEIANKPRSFNGINMDVIGNTAIGGESIIKEIIITSSKKNYNFEEEENESLL
jgi:hypothetical protein